MPTGSDGPSSGYPFPSVNPPDGCTAVPATLRELVVTVQIGATMKGKLVFLAGTALGYVLGSRAGRKRYEQIRAGAEKFWNSPTVQKRVDQVQSFVDDKAPEVQAAVADRAKKVVGQVTKRSNGSSSQGGSSSTVGGTPPISTSSTAGTSATSAET